MHKKSTKIEHLYNINFSYDKGKEMSRWKDLQNLDSFRYRYTFNAPEEEERKYKINIHRHTNKKGYDLDTVGVLLLIL